MILAPFRLIFLVKLNGLCPGSCRRKVKNAKPDTMKTLDNQAIFPGSGLFYKICISTVNIPKACDYQPSADTMMSLAFRAPPFSSEKSLTARGDPCGFIR
jgi:hypothetical protein